MADEEHVKRLQKGVPQWNKWRWRIANLLTPVNLSGADLSGAGLRHADLSGADLSGTILSDADLSGANLRGGNLSGTILSDAKLYGANLNDANLSDANLSGGKHLDGTVLMDANLSGANLSGANLYGTNLRGAILTGANLYGASLIRARLGETVFGDVGLTGVTGLEQCYHLGPSIIDHRTLQKSGPLPRVFLRGVGLPDNLIEYLPSLLNQAIQHYSCFISYSSKDDEFANRIHADLQNSGVRCWFAPHDLPIGAKTWDAIDEAIKLRDKLLLVLSNNSIGSDWVEDEVQKAFAEERDRKGLVLFPVRIDDAVMETPEPWARKLRDQRNVGDFRKWKDHDAYKQSFERVLRDLTKPQAQ
jgi:uncharacterized protein YjbI with pentapeptide repeats